MKGCGKQWKRMKNPGHSKTYWIVTCGKPLFYEKSLEGLIPCKIQLCAKCVKQRNDALETKNE